ncbi:hypothetical protein AB0M80_36865 [Amycolatopsis sp. NPDC051045]|uniref:hypothetical protein n=1 Tax=Amycolatopsis sp. NPDC051045 TaxID=3156922 RepID=UPI00341DE6BA
MASAAYPLSKRRTPTVPSKPSRTFVKVVACRSCTTRFVADSSMGWAPPSTNSQSSWCGCQANFTKPGLLTVPAQAAGERWASRPGPAPKSATPAAWASNSRSLTGTTGPPCAARHSCSR